MCTHLRQASDIAGEERSSLLIRQTETTNGCDGVGSESFAKLRVLAHQLRNLVDRINTHLLNFP